MFSWLLRQHGPQGWWPCQGGPFEVMVGAVLTQNTAWVNVEKAIHNLHQAEALDAGTILGMPETRLAQLIRPSGYYNIKAGRLRNLCRWYVGAGGFERLRQQDTGVLRRELLSIKGVGPETGDDILLYAFHRPVFVVDAYTFRLFERTGLIDSGHDYESLRAWVESRLGPDVKTFNELHALIVRHGNRVCRPRPLCDDCELRSHCRYNQAD
ncbi:endonuclease III domain-containing protein [Natronospira sp. AB-CW4]|uniref:Endonuclease III domain-containing protein n=1 Tax=Natronospira bacteriovora TaxID=3069753 RepID=A0ABU0W595_9GAMM|nr:endonuclease III domain-containing protein [Natronospira sp. AB-CW4]MDQ2069166.1 endonuclease III domain-containing protein [Natronospira sp. AB-CW4]